MNATTQPNEDFQYGFYCVAWLDILGQRRKLRELSRLSVDDQKTVKLLRETAGCVLRLRKRLEDSFESFTKETGLLEGAPKELQERIASAKQSVKYRYFSDSIIMQIPFIGDKDQFEPMTGVYKCIGACSILHACALASKEPIRGGIEVGRGLNLYEDKDEVYGPVLENAHYLESEVADYPRIVVGEGLLTYLSTIESKSLTTPFSQIAKNLAARCTRMTTMDSDGFHMLDFLGDEIASNSFPAARRELLKGIIEYISEQKQIARTEQNHKHQSRYFRLGAYVEKCSERWNSD